MSSLQSRLFDLKPESRRFQRLCCQIMLVGAIAWVVVKCVTFWLGILTAERHAIIGASVIAWLLFLCFRRFRFGLIGFFVFVTLVAAAFAFLFNPIVRYRQERAAFMAMGQNNSIWPGGKRVVCPGIPHGIGATHSLKSYELAEWQKEWLGSKWLRAQPDECILAVRISQVDSTVRSFPFEKLGNLNCLEFSGRNINDDSLRLLGDLDRRPLAVRLSGTKVTRVGLRYLANFPLVHALDVSGNEYLTASDLSELAESNVKSLKFSTMQRGRLSVGELMSVSKITSLKHLTLSVPYSQLPAEIKFYPSPHPACPVSSLDISFFPLEFLHRMDTIKLNSGVSF